MTARALLLQKVADLPEDDIRALLGVVERLRAKHLAPRVEAAEPVSLVGVKLHPERFGGLVGSVRFEGDIESPVEDTAAWTGDLEHLGK